jgi:hypothetical protein
VRVEPLDALHIDTSGFPADEPWLHVTPVTFGDRHGLLLSTRQTFKGAGEDGGEQKGGEGGGRGGCAGCIVSELHLFTEDNDGGGSGEGGGGGGGGSMGRLVRVGQWTDAGDPTNVRRDERREEKREEGGEEGGEEEGEEGGRRVALVSEWCS